ncbi:hypothetical protein OG21DRAFT_1484169 [Imleria badia]|nr:hypothetical protein OG21DRAFT_1484169 [Imleria badia]
MLRHSTRAAFAVLSFPGAELRQAISTILAPVSLLLPPPTRPAQSNPSHRGLHISRFAPPSSSVKRIPALALQPRKSFPRQSTANNAPPSPSLTSTRAVIVPGPPSSKPDEASITVTSSRATVLSPFAPLTSSPQLQPQPLHQSPIPEPASLLPPQITPVISITREPSSPNATKMLSFKNFTEVKLQVLKDGGAIGEEGEAEAKSSLAYIQLEKHNERLKGALIRYVVYCRSPRLIVNPALSAMSQQTSQDQRRRIAEMEKVITSINDLQDLLFLLYATSDTSAYNRSIRNNTHQALTQNDDLKAQLDDALGAEEMLKIEEMRILIEDLEALKELNDALEENYIETEKALQEEIDSKDTQFRELVLQLQSDLDNLRTQTQTAQHESATAASQTAPMMSLNLKLQEVLGIVQPYLPRLYVESDSDATNCYLFFQRMGLKIDFINTIVGQAHGLPGPLNGDVSETVVMRGRTAALAILCRRFAAILRRCDPTSFLNIGRIYPEIAPMAKRAVLKAHLVGQLKSLSNAVPELVNFGISLARQLIPHLSDARSAKSSFQLATVLSYAKQIAMSTVAKDLRPGASCWEAVGDAMAQPKTLSSSPRKATQFQDELQSLARSLKATVQESTVKIELMEHRMEASKKQSDAIMRSSSLRARKQERAYEEAIEQLQANLDALEQDDAKLKTMAAPETRYVVHSVGRFMPNDFYSIAAGNQPAESDNVPIEGSVETSRSLEQIEALRGTVRFRRTENSYLKG